MSNPKVLIPVALGTNRDADLAHAFELAGADVECVPMAALRAGERRLSDFQILAVAGGFSYGDALGAGRLLGLDLAGWFSDQVMAAVAAGKPVFGVCNGFQALVKAFQTRTKRKAFTQPSTRQKPVRSSQPARAGPKWLRTSSRAA